MSGTLILNSLATPASTPGHIQQPVHNTIWLPYVDIVLEPLTFWLGFRYLVWNLLPHTFR